MASENASSSTESETRTHAGRAQPAQGPVPAGRLEAKGARKTGDAYRDSSEFATERMNALLSAYAVLASGAQEIQRTYLEVLQRSMEMAAAGQHDLMQCKSLSDVAEVQRDLMRKNLDEWLEGGSKLLHVSSRIVEDAVRPIEDKIRREAA